MKYLRWLILGATLFFFAKALKDHWRDVVALEVTGKLGVYSAIALGITLLAILWSGWVWGWILRSLNLQSQPSWVLRVYLKTNMAKYLPGNVWHLYGRLWAVKAAGGSLEMATLGALLEPALMAAAAVILALIITPLTGLFPITSFSQGSLPLLGLGGVLTAIHPRILNPILRLVRRLKGKGTEVAQQQIEHYLWLPLLGEMAFVILRGSGFVVLAAAFTSMTLKTIGVLLGAFCCAWFLGLVIPVPGGIGVFETTAIALLDEYINTGVILGFVALFRLIGLSAEAIAAAGALLSERVHKG